MATEATAEVSAGRTFRGSLIGLVIGLGLGAWYGYATASVTQGAAMAAVATMATVFLLGVLEVSFSFDNAVINASVLKQMSAKWQNIFMTVGIAIAVFGMRLVFPLLLVMATAGLSMGESIHLALTNHTEYSHLLENAHPAIAAFGGTFLLMIFLDFVFEDRDIKWLRWLEVPLAKIGKLDQLSVIIALAAVIGLSKFAVAPADSVRFLVAGVLGLFSYLIVNGLSEFFESSDDDAQDSDDDTEDGNEAGIHGPAESDTMSAIKANGAVALKVGKAAFFSFLYLEVLDASFSFDGVVGAFAITTDPIIIALGLGIGALFVRSLTVYLVRQGTLDDYHYLEHGAHWAIGALAVILLTQVDLPEVVTGSVGVVLIVLSFLSSIRRNKRLARETARALAA